MRDRAHLLANSWLFRRRALGVLHTGPRVFPLGDRIIAVPVATLWS
ncbi:MAG: hypothetical protein ACRDTG_10815 [Pseudonocardiaceae bacterium]